MQMVRESTCTKVHKSLRMRSARGITHPEAAAGAAAQAFTGGHAGHRVRAVSVPAQLLHKQEAKHPVAVTPASVICFMSHFHTRPPKRNLQTFQVAGRFVELTCCIGLSSRALLQHTTSTIGGYQRLSGENTQ